MSKCEEKGNPDGMKLDIKGNLYATGPGGVWIFAPDGEVLARIFLPEVAANLGWAEQDGKTLYITASTSVYRMKCITGGRVLKRLI